MGYAWEGAVSQTQTLEPVCQLNRGWWEVLEAGTDQQRAPVIETPTWQPAPSWLVSSVGRALHRYHRGHGFKSCTDLNFSRPYFHYSLSSVHCEDCVHIHVLEHSIKSYWLISPNRFIMNLNKDPLLVGLLFQLV